MGGIWGSVERRLKVVCFEMYNSTTRTWEQYRIQTFRVEYVRDEAWMLTLWSGRYRAYFNPVRHVSIESV